jgi:hypothetical protein
MWYFKEFIWRILKDIFDFKCGSLKFYSVLELHFLTFYVMVYYNNYKLILTLLPLLYYC